jgi:hypothetical protein
MICNQHLARIPFGRHRYRISGRPYRLDYEDEGPRGRRALQDLPVGKSFSHGESVDFGSQVVIL